MYVELDNQYSFVQYHETKETVTEEHKDLVIEITDDLYESLQNKMPWKLPNFQKNKIYDVEDVNLFEEIVPNFVDPDIVLKAKIEIQTIEVLLDLGVI